MTLKIIDEISELGGSYEIIFAGDKICRAKFRWSRLKFKALAARFNSTSNQTLPHQLQATLPYLAYIVAFNTLVFTVALIHALIRLPYRAIAVCGGATQ